MGLSETVWPGVPEASAGVTLFELAEWRWSRQDSPGIVQKGKQRQDGLVPKMSGGRRESSGGGLLLYARPVVEVLRKNTLRSRNASSETGLAHEPDHGAFAPVARSSLNFIRV